MRAREPIWLASTSSRRRRLLLSAGIDFRSMPPDVDDAALSPAGHCAVHWTMAMAYLKARRVADMLEADGVSAGTVIGADTVCRAGSEIFGQPGSPEQAAEMLARLRGATHDVITGLSLIDLGGGERLLLVERAEVTVGPLSDQLIDEYVREDLWRGKAGGYNLEDRLAAGWPIRCHGDPTTVMGLPLQRLGELLAEGKARSS